MADRMFPVILLCISKLRAVAPSIFSCPLHGTMPPLAHSTGQSIIPVMAPRGRAITRMRALIWSCTCLGYSLLAKPPVRDSVCCNQHRSSGFLTWYASLFLLKDTLKVSLFLISLTGDVVRLQRRQVVGNERAAMREGEKGGSCTRTLSKADHLECVR